MSVSAELLRDLRIALLRELYRVQPRGRSARSLHALVQPEVECAPADVAAQLEFLAGESLAGKLPDNDLSPGLDPLWRITSAGMKYCEGKHIV
jgi:hypothetical protein